MNIEQPQRRDRGEPVAPMINVVFLLLIFFMMAATLAPPDPIKVTPPVSSSDDDSRVEAVLLIGADGTMAFGEVRGEAALQAIATRQREDETVTISVRADSAAPAVDLANALSSLKKLGAARVALVVESQ